MSKYRFEYMEFDEEICHGVANNRTITFEAQFDECEQWEVPLKSFVDFLSSIYGYDISDQITLETNFESHSFKSVPRDEEYFRPFDDTDDLK